MEERHAGGRLVGIDVLRAIAALLVVLTHTDLDFSALPEATHPIGWVFRQGGVGVSLFLVISGFSIAGRWTERRDAQGHFPVRAFWTRRFLRLYPTFWVAAVASLGLLVLADGWHATLHKPLPWQWTGGQMPWSVQLFSYAAVVTANLLPLAHMGRAWSLALEEQLYALFTLVQVRWPDSLTPVRMLVGGVAVDVCYRLAIFLAHPGWGAPSSLPVPAKELLLFFQVPALVLAWLAGWVVAEARKGTVALPRWARSRALGAGLFGISVAAGHWGGPIWHVGGGRVVAPVDLVLDLGFVASFFCLVAACGLDDQHLAPVRATRVLAWIGTWAYSLYLIHPPVLELVDRRFGLPTLPRVLVGWSLSLLAAWLLWIFVERFWVGQASRVGRPGQRAAGSVGAGG